MKIFRKKLDQFWRFVLKVSFNKVYPKNETFVNEVNSETWVGAQIESGGHALSTLKPIGDYEAISIRCVISGNRSATDDICTKDIDYWSKEWLP